MFQGFYFQSSQPFRIVSHYQGVTNTSNEYKWLMRSIWIRKPVVVSDSVWVLLSFLLPAVSLLSVYTGWPRVSSADIRYELQPHWHTNTGRNVRICLFPLELLWSERLYTEGRTFSSFPHSVQMHKLVMIFYHLLNFYIKEKAFGYKNLLDNKLIWDCDDQFEDIFPGPEKHIWHSTEILINWLIEIN